ncbi:MAG: AAA domain-containing protein, partial [Nitrospirales bacterium]|nr:AAA domain-containing protein [Nitrospirales bacterium]
MNFSSFVGNEEAQLALILNAVDPRCGGLLIAGERGTGKSTLCRLFRSIIPQEASFVELPLNITEDSLLGGVDLEATMREGKRIFRKGVLALADRGVLFADDINLLPPPIQSLLMEVQGKGAYRLEREGMSLRLPARFTPIATMNPEEGCLSPHLLDRFGMCVFLSAFQEKGARLQVMKGGNEGDDEELKNRIREARNRLKEIVISPKIHDRIVEICLENNAFSHRADIFLLYAARACAAFLGEREVTEEHLERVAPLVLLHRRIEPQPMPPQEEQQEQQKGEHKESHNHEHQEPRGDRPDPGEGSDLSDNEGEGGGKEEVFGIGSTFGVRRLSFRRDRQKRTASGRRTKTASKDR